MVEPVAPAVVARLVAVVGPGPSTAGTVQGVLVGPRRRESPRVPPRAAPPGPVGGRGPAEARASDEEKGRVVLPAEDAGHGPPRRRGDGHPLRVRGQGMQDVLHSAVAPRPAPPLPSAPRPALRPSPCPPPRPAGTDPCSQSWTHPSTRGAPRPSVSDRGTDGGVRLKRNTRSGDGGRRAKGRLQRSRRARDDYRSTSESETFVGKVSPTGTTASPEGAPLRPSAVGGDSSRVCARQRRSPLTCTDRGEPPTDDEGEGGDVINGRDGAHVYPGVELSRGLVGQAVRNLVVPEDEGSLRPTP